MKYHLDSMLPLRAFTPRSGRARGFAAGGMTLEGSDWGGYNYYEEPAPAPVDAGAIVQQMYQDILGRAPDPGGFEAFVNAVNSGADVGQLAQSMANSQEAQNNAASGQGPSQQHVQEAVNQASSDPGTYVQQAAVNNTNRDYVTALYQGILGRAPDAQGLQDNIDALASGRVTPEQLASSFAASSEAGSNKIPAAQEKAMAEAMASSYGKPEAQIGTDSRGYPTNWENVSPAQLVKMGITNPVILKAAADGVLDNPTFGALGLDANTVKNAVNNNTALPQEFIKAQENTASSFTPNGKVVGVKNANAAGTQKVYYYTDGSTALINKDGTIDHITPPASNYRQLEGSIAVADNPGMVMFNGQLVKVETPQLNWDPSAGKVFQDQSGITRTYDPGPQGGMGPIGWTSGQLANFDSSVRDVVPGGWQTIGMIAASALSAGTLAPMAGTVGGALLGGTAATTGAVTLGTAVIGASTSALMAAISGGDVGKAALVGAIGGAIGVNSVEIANGLVGADTIKAIASATGQTTTQVANLITNAVSTGISGAATGKGDIASLVGSTLASTAVGNYTGNILRGLDSNVINKVAGSVSTIARVGTTAALNGKDPQQAITNSMGQIIGNLVSQNLIRPGIDSVKQAIKNDNTATPAQKTEAQKNAELIDNGFKQLVAENTEVTPEQLNQYLASQSYVEPKNTFLQDFMGSTAAGGNVATDTNLTSAELSQTGYRLNPDNTYMLDASGNKIPVDLTGGSSGITGGGGTSSSSGIAGNQSTDSSVPSYEQAKKDLDAELEAGTMTKAEYDSYLAKIQPQETVTPTPPLDDTIESLLDSMWEDYMAGVKTNQTAPNPTFSASNITNPVDTSGVGSPTAPNTDTTGGMANTATTTGPGGATTGGTAAGGSGTTGEGLGGTGTGTGTGGTGTGTGGGTGGSGSGGTGGTGGTGTIPAPKPSIKIPTAAGNRTATSTTIPSMGGTGIVNLVGSTLKGSGDYNLIESPFDEAPMQYFADGGSTTSAFESALADLSNSILGETVSGIPKLTGSALKPNVGYELLDSGVKQPLVFKYAEGGEVKEHQPQFFSEGGLGAIDNRYVKGDGDGTSDSVPAMLANGEFVIPADVVSALGNGSNDSGSEVLDEFLKVIRQHKRRADAKHLPPDSKGPLAYLLEANKKVRT